MVYMKNPTHDTKKQITEGELGKAIRAGTQSIRSHYLLLLIAIVAVEFVTIPIFTSRIMQSIPAGTPEKDLVLPVKKPLFLTILSPGDQTGHVNGEVLVSGQTLPNTVVAVYSDTDDTMMESDATGAFEGTVVVSSNGGLLRISAFAKTGEEVSQTVAIAPENTFNVLGKTTKDPSKDNSSNSQKDTKAASGGQKQDNMNEKPPKEEKTVPTKKIILPQVLAPTKAAKLTITAREVATFKSGKQIEVKPKKIGTAKLKEMLASQSSTSATVKKLNKFQVQSASSSAVMKRHAVMGVITALSEGSITIAHQIQSERVSTILYNGTTIISGKDISSSSSAQFEVGMRITAVGIPSDAGLLATRIHIIPGKAIGVINRLATGSAGLISGTPIPATVAATPTDTDSPVATQTPTITDQ